MDPMQNTSPAPTIPVSNIPGGEEKGSGALIGSIIIILVLILGGLYLWNSKMDDQEMMDDMMMKDGTMMEGDTMPAAEEDAAAAAFGMQGASDETADIEADLNASAYENMDAELNDL